MNQGFMDKIIDLNHFKPILRSLYGSLIRTLLYL